MYIGRKQCISITSKKEEGKTRKKKILKESNWLTYTSSCKELNDDIKLYGKDAFVFVIYEWVTGKGLLTYRECQDQWLEEVLSKDTNEHGERWFYNGNIGAVKFLKPDK
jgi:hypothetical protein